MHINSKYFRLIELAVGFFTIFILTSCVETPANQAPLDTLPIASPEAPTQAPEALLPTALPEDTTTISGTVVWLEEPIKLTADPGVIEITEENDDFFGYVEGYDGISYYKIGADDGRDLILGIFTIPGPGDSMGKVAFLKQDDEAYILLSQHSILGDNDTPNYQDGFTKKVALSKSIKYPDLVPPATFTMNGVEMKLLDYWGGDWFSNYKKSYNMRRVAENNYGTMYRAQMDTQRNENEYIRKFKYITGIWYVLRLHDGTAFRYKQDFPILDDALTPNITWADGTKNDTYYVEGFTVFQCGGSAGEIVGVKNNLNGLSVSGTAVLNNGEKINIYEFTNQNNPVFGEFYDRFYVIDDYNQGLNDLLSKQEALKKHPIIAYKNELGDVIFLRSSNFGPVAECGKPVIYLYPEQKTTVNVKVRAKITVSEPLYNDGWQVTAYPNGKLINQDGKTYNSLFWEGTGLVYPEIKSGAVVTHADIEKTLWKNLLQQGLNVKEATDFMDFWLPRMPTTPYARLTWFNTAQVNGLAPLIVSPRPETIIRLFLDFEGLQKPIPLEPQTLESIPRKGFTLVEWGGLLK